MNLAEPAHLLREPWRRTHVAGRLLGQELWILSGQFALFVCVFMGFGASQPDRPKAVFLLGVAAVAGVVLLGPVGNLRRVFVSLPVVGFFAWFVASRAWTFNVFSWGTQTRIQLTLVIACVVVFSLLPLDAIAAALVTSCYVVLAYSVFFTVVHPSLATSASGVPGWHAGFIHKNAMSPFLLFAILIVCTFETRRAPKLLAVAVSLFFVAMSQSTTSLAIGIVLLPGWFILGRLNQAATQNKRVILLVTSAVTVTVGLLAVVYLPDLLAARGKDLTLSKRTEIWSQVWLLIKRRPWTGYGIGGVWANPAAEPTRSLLNRLGFVVFHSHNGYLQLLVLLGWIGLALFLWIVVTYLHLGLLVMRTTHPALGRFMILYATLMLVASASEVMTLDIWLAMLCGLLALAMRLLAHPSERAAGALRGPAVSSRFSGRSGDLVGDRFR